MVKMELDRRRSGRMVADSCVSPVRVNMNKAKIIPLHKVSNTRNIDVVRMVKWAVDKKLNYLLAGLAVNVADALFEEMNSIEEQRALNSHFNIMRGLKLNGGLFREEFGLLVNLSWAALLNARDRQAVPDTDAEITQLLKAYSDRNLNHYKVLLRELQLKFSGLCQKEMSFHPLLPGNFYLCFWFATEKLGLTYDERCLLIPLFNRFVMDRFGQVLSVAHQALIDQGIENYEEVCSVPSSTESS